ncbi:hypothetical protein, partial [Azospirillum argentinense]|uniref:hypothetical protein n=1 Tax=Azospirillum argentinense TaxID=2970906 RepID=UPI001A908273
MGEFLGSRSQVLALLETFHFRYRVIVGAPKQPEQEMLLRHAVAMRADPLNYDIRMLRDDMRRLIAASASDEVFADRIGNLRYNRDVSVVCGLPCGSGGPRAERWASATPEGVAGLASW